MNVHSLSRLLINGLMTLENIPNFEGLTCYFTTIPFLDAHPGLTDFAASPRSQKAGGRINEEYIYALCDALELPYAGFETGRQTHGTNVIKTKNRGRIHHPDCDGLLVRAGGAAGVFLADCQPIILWHPKSSTAAVLHAGWRGTVAGMARAGLESISRIGSVEPRDVYAFLGPCISAANYEVGAEVVEAVERSGIDQFAIIHREGKPFFDLTQANALVLIQAGIPDSNIHSSAICTFDSPDYFYSFRRDGEDAGRFMAAIHIE